VLLLTAWTQPAVRESLRVPSAMVGAAIVGGVSYLSPHTLYLLALFPVLVTLARSRRGAAAVAWAFFAAPCSQLVGVLERWIERSGQPVGDAGLYGYPLMLSLLLALPFLLVNPAATPARRAAQMAIALVLLTLPPFGLVAWINPVFLAAALFPGGGLVWGGLLGLVVLSLLAARPWESSEVVLKLAFAACLVVVVGAHSLDSLRRAPLAPPGWYGIDTEHGPGLPSHEARDFRIALIEAQAKPYLAFPDTALLVFPESLLPDFEDDDHARLAPFRAALASSSATALLGVTPKVGEDQWLNQLLKIGAAGEGVAAESRIPVPVGNWRTGGDGVPLKWLDSGLVTLDGRVAHLTICYEEFPIWAHLRADRAEVLVSVANQWMLNPAVLTYQETAIHAVQRLTRKPLVRATNRLPPPLVSSLSN